MSEENQNLDLSPGDSAPSANGHKLTNLDDVAREGTLVRLPASIRKLQTLGINVRAAGLSEIKTGSLLVTLEGAGEIEKALSKTIKDLAQRPFNETDETDEDGNPVGATAGQSLALCANAYANIMKGKAACVKVLGEIAAGERQTKGRRSFAKGQQIGPIVDVKPT